MFTVLPADKGRALHIKASGRLTHKDYVELTPEIDRQITESGPIRMLLDAEEFEGWDLRAAWDDMVLGIRHWGDFERIAIVGDKKWEERAAWVLDHVWPGEIRFYPVEKVEAAWAWVCGD